MLAILAPGQGAQAPGFLRPWLDLDGIADRLRWAGAVVGRDLIAAGTTAGADEIRDTALAQPLLVGAGLAVAAELSGEPVPSVAAVAGHSVGELTVSAVAGALSTEAALALVAERGRAMAGAAARSRTGMTAVLGGDPAEVAAALDAHGLSVACSNAAGQLVAAGPAAGLAAFAAAPPVGARLRPLEVAGAFHTGAMASARDALAVLAPGVPIRDPQVPVVSNADGAVVTGGADLLRRLVAQVSTPVRFDACLRTLADLGVQVVLELPPAGTLAGLARRALPDATVLPLRSPDDLPHARSLIADHAPPAALPSPPWRLLVAPFTGVFRSAPVDAGARLAAGAEIGRVEARREAATVTVAHPGVLVEWLAADGDPVGPGQPLARLHPVGGDR